MSDYSTRALEHWQDSPDALPVGTPTVVLPGRTANLTLGPSHAEEVYRVRNRPELYSEWHVDMVNTQRAAFIETLDWAAYDWDCERCKRAVITSQHPALNPRCPFCGAR